MWDPYAEFQSETLPNGLAVYAAHWPEKPWEAMGFIVHSGAEHDPIGLEGLAHFVEHLVSSNASVSEEEMTAFFENCGGTVDLGNTGYPATKYRFFAPADKTILSKAFSMFGYMLLSARLEKSVEHERQIIDNEFCKEYPDTFKFDLNVREQKALYTGCWLERFVLPFGNQESIKRITQSDLQSYYDANYTPANMSIVGVGGITLAELVSLLNKSPFAMSKNGLRTPLPIQTSSVNPPLETRYVFEVSEHITTQSPSKIGSYRSVAKIPGNAKEMAIKILREIVEVMLYEEVRKKRAWVYSIKCSRHNFRHFHEFSIGCPALAPKALDEIEEIVEYCIASVENREDLFEQTKQRILASCRMVDETGASIRNGALIDLAEYQRIVSLAEYIAKVEQITMSDVYNLLKWLRPEQRWTLIVKP